MQLRWKFVQLATVAQLFGTFRRGRSGGKSVGGGKMVISGNLCKKMIAFLQELTVFCIIMVLFGKKLVDFLAFPYKILYICSKIRIASFLPLRVC